jgi:antagonist of KipI
VIAILDPGAQTTVQDSGRCGCLRFGIPPSGPVDRYAYLLANRLVGNADNAAALECTVTGVRFVSEATCTFAVTGAAMPVSVNGEERPAWAAHTVGRGDMVKIGHARAGLRSYVAFSGGIDVPLALRSRSTYLRGRLGGLDGRVLRRGDRLALFPGGVARPARVAPEAIPTYASAATARVILGPQAHRFTPDAIATLLGTAFEMSPQSDRMGARLRGAPLAHVRGPDIISDAIAEGSIQVPGDGQPIVLLADRQSTGGYAKIATVCSFDVWRIAQVRPGQSVRFEAVSLGDAHRLLREAIVTLERALG